MADGLGLLLTTTALLRAGQRILASVRERISPRNQNNARNQQQPLLAGFPAAEKARLTCEFQVYLDSHSDEIASTARETRGARDYRREQGVELEIALPYALDQLFELVSEDITKTLMAHIRRQYRQNSEEYVYAEFIERLRREADDFHDYLVTLRLMKYAVDDQVPSVYGLDISFPALADTLLGRKKYLQDIGMMQKRTLTTSDLLVGNTTCGICQASLREGDRVKVLPCGEGHLLHDDDPPCGDYYFAKSNHCPTCGEVVF